MAEQPVNLSTVLYLGVFSRAEQRVLQAIFKAIVERGRCVATLAMLARDSNTSKSTTRNAGNSLRLENGAAGRITRTSPMGLARIMARAMLFAMHRGKTGVRTLPALLVLAVSGTTAGADTAVMRPPSAGAERIMDAKQVMQLAAIVRSTGYACQEGIFVAYKLQREADAQRFEVMCLGNGALGGARMRRYIMQIQDDASLALESTP
jgi:hypothetical protein